MARAADLPSPASGMVDTSLSGAEALLSTLVANGVNICFANPGTSEMHFVAALDRVPDMRAILALTEGVVAGAADGYGRMTGKPAATLFHLGPGFSNGLSNLHNARRACTPLLAIVGDHATYHKAYDPPLESDIDALAGTVSLWVRRSWRAEAIGRDTAAAVAAAQRGGVATLLLPADVSWGRGARVGETLAPDMPPPTSQDALQRAEAVLRSGEPTILLIGGRAVASDEALAAAAAVACVAGAKLLCETFPARAVRGAGRPALGRLAYPVDVAIKQLAGTRHLILAGVPCPVAPFAYPGKASQLVPADCQVHNLAGDSAVDALIELARRLKTVPAPTVTLERPALPEGALTAAKVATVVAALMPDNAIIVDEAITSGATLNSALKSAPAHDLLTLPGGSIGFALPSAIGAAVACPDRAVICLEGDGSAMYTIAALWTQARERLNVTTIIYDNGTYAVLHGELKAVLAGSAGVRARRLLDIDEPPLDFVSIAEGFGVPASRAATVSELVEQLGRALSEPGPHLISASVKAEGL
jgi:acetolactate synthase-1/2/3 large subunit